MPDLAQYAANASHGASRSRNRSSGGRAKLELCENGRDELEPDVTRPFPLTRKPAIRETAASRLTANPNPAQSSVGSSPTTWKPTSKLLTIGRTSACGSTDNPD